MASKITDYPLRSLLFIFGLAGCFASMILTCGAILYNADPPNFSGSWWQTDLVTWVFIAKFISGVVISIVQSTSLIMHRITKKNSQLIIFWGSTALSCFITIVTFHNGLQQAAANAKHSDAQYLSLIDDEKRLKSQIDAITAERAQLIIERSETFKSGYKTDSRKYEATISKRDWLITKRGEELKDIKRQIATFDGGDSVSTEGTYDTIAKDMKTLFSLGPWADERLVLIITYLVLIMMATMLDLGSTSMIAFAVCGPGNVKRRQADGPGFFEQLFLNAQARLLGPTPIAAGKMLEDKELQLGDGKVNIREIMAALPDRPCITSVVKSMEKRILIVGGSDSGKTTTLAEILKLYVAQLAKAGNRANIYVIDPKRKRDIWPAGVKVIGAGQNYDEIKDFMESRKALSDARSLMTESEIKKAESEIYIIDECKLLQKEFKDRYEINFGDLWSWIMTFARENKIFCTIISQSKTAGSLGLKGEYDVTNSFSYTISQRLYEDDKVKCRYIVLERPGMRPALFSPPKISAKKNRPGPSLLESLGNAAAKKWGGIVGGGQSDNHVDSGSNINNVSQERTEWECPESVTQSDTAKNSARHSGTQNDGVTESAKNECHHGTPTNTGSRGVIGYEIKESANGATVPVTLSDTTENGVKTSNIESVDVTGTRNKNDGNDLSEVGFSDSEKRDLLKAFFDLSAIGKTATPTGAVVIGLGSNKKNSRTVTAARKFLISAGAMPPAGGNGANN